MYKSVAFLALVLFCVIEPKIAAAQILDFFSSGPAIETIETADLNVLITARQQAEAKATAAGEQPEEAGFVLVDVRSDAEQKVSLIPGAITKAAFEKDAKKYQDRTVIVYCLSGGRSKAYAKQLVGKGAKVKNYQGSILAWVNAELPLVTPEGKPTNRVHTVSDRYQVPAKYEQVTQ
ncbi:rhodanese-like domain-containing protein [Allorhodopirellula heiligendammensis]|uniref:Molybdopterin biosynthesis protein MoeB n=1 Tax=Allorhodopirellula heiligendammensis TaxID=2714739 RepID=A0A5C6BZG2_9BACT|nr:rhodanese-like domain-containing protein [Allorhodopirellula heiligendammensis]TWU16324.1 molybdopterin biosynthesis protein MoeB [Allorhodopirellula heiligendammensis]